MISGKPVYVALAQRKELRRQQLAVQMQQRAIRMPQGPMPGGPQFPGTSLFNNYF
jgi:polyadenylate-binding protein